MLLSMIPPRARTPESSPTNEPPGIPRVQPIRGQLGGEWRSGRPIRAARFAHFPPPALLGPSPPSPVSRRRSRRDGCHCRHACPTWRGARSRAGRPEEGEGRSAGARHGRRPLSRSPAPVSGEPKWPPPPPPPSLHYSPPTGRSPEPRSKSPGERREAGDISADQSGARFPMQ